MSRDHHPHRARFCRLLIALWATVLGPAVARSQTTTPPQPQPPRVAFDMVGGGAGGRESAQPTLRSALSVRLGSGNHIAPFVAVEIGAIGSGYKWNVGHVRPDGSLFDAPNFLGGPAGAFGLRAALTTCLLVSGSGGVAMLESSGHPGRFLDSDISFAPWSRLALLGGVRRMWYYDPHGALNRTVTPIVVGWRFRSRR
jgi:hypothetical protein